MVRRPAAFNAFEFVVMSAQRAAQLSKGCIPLIPSDAHKHITTAQMEVASYRIVRTTVVPAGETTVDEPVDASPVVAELSPERQSTPYAGSLDRGSEGKAGEPGDMAEDLAALK